MDDELTALFRDRHQKGAAFDAIGALNTSGRTDYERVELDLAYEAAKQAYYAADRKYYEAITERASAENKRASNG